MAESLEERDSAVVSSAGEPGPLSRLLQELADASGDDAVDAWRKELQPGDRLGRFEIRREVGRGGFGAVYEAFDTELNRAVAVKTLRLSRPRRDLSSDWIKKEAEAVARLDHPCIVTLFDVGTGESGPYLVMELLRGKTISQRIAEGPIPLAEALRIAGEMAKGLAHAHQRGVLHRDLKPANVFLTEDGRVKLLDFGLAHLLGAEGESGAGTPKYMAPEQARGEEVDQRADVYAAARVLGEMVGERRPRRVERAIASATQDDPAMRPRDGQAWLDLLEAARRAVERPARMRRVGILAGFGVVLGGLVVGVAVHRASRPVATARGRPSIAVLAFKNLSTDKDQEYFSDGVAEEILNALARVPGLWVPGRTSSFHFKGKDARLEDIGRELKVDHVLGGSVRRSGSKVRVSAEVVKVDTGERVWSQSFDREFTDIFAVQDEIARSAVDALRVKLLQGQQVLASEYQPKSQEAYQSYLLGKHFARSASKDSQRRAMAAFEKAVELDPAFVQAWAALARATLSAGTVGAIPWSEARRAALAAASRAVESGPGLAEAFSARAQARLVEWDWAGAKSDIDRALALAPDDENAASARATYARWMGRTQESVEWRLRRIEMDPLDGAAWNGLGVAYLEADRFEEAEKAFARALEVDPEHAFARNNRCMVLIASGRPEEVIASLPGGGSGGLCGGMAQFALGKVKESQRALDQMVAKFRSPPGDGLLSIAFLHAFRGEVDSAFEWLERGRQAHVRAMNAIRTNRELRPLHSDPRWAELLRRMNLPVD